MTDGEMQAETARLRMATLARWRTYKVDKRRRAYLAQMRKVRGVLEKRFPAYVGAHGILPQQEREAKQIMCAVVLREIEPLYRFCLEGADALAFAEIVRPWHEALARGEPLG